VKGGGKVAEGHKKNIGSLMEVRPAKEKRKTESKLVGENIAGETEKHNNGDFKRKRETHRWNSSSVPGS